MAPFPQYILEVLKAVTIGKVNCGIISKKCSNGPLYFSIYAETTYVTGIGDPILSPCVYFPLLSICIT